MNYQQYLEIKTNCEKKIKYFSYAIYVVTFLAILQASLLILKVDLHFPYFNMFILDQFFSMAYNRMAEHNIIFAIAFYGAFAFVILIFVVSCFYWRRGRRFPYIFVIFFYSIDALLCIATASYIQLAIHIVLLAFTMAAYKNRNYLVMLKNNIWGYK